MSGFSLDEAHRGAIGDLRPFQESGLESVRRYVRGELPGAPIHRLTGLWPTDVGLGKVTFAMPITRWFEDAFGLVWAGTFALFADAPLGVAIWTGLPPGKTVATSELNLSFVRPFARDTGNLVGRAVSIHQGRQVGLSEVEISDRNGRIMGHGTSRCLIVDVPVDLDAEYPEPDLGADGGDDPYLRVPPNDGYLDLETVIEGEPIEIQKRIVGGEVTPNVQRLTGARWHPPEPGRITGEFPTSPWFSAGGPTLYGGAIAWFAETTMGSAVYSTVGPGEVFVTLDMNVRFTRPAPINSGMLTVNARVNHHGRRLRIASAEVLNAEEKLVAMASSSALVVPGGVTLTEGWIPEEVLQG